MALRACDQTTARATTLPSQSTPMGIASKPTAVVRHHRENHCDSQFANGIVIRLVCVHDKHREEFGRLCLAGIGAAAVAVAGQLGPALLGLVSRQRSVVDLTADRLLKHGRRDEDGFGMRVTGRVAARTIFDEHALTLSPGTFGSSCW